MPSLSGTALIWGFLHSRVPGRKKGMTPCFQIQVEIPLSARDSSPVPSTPHRSANDTASVRIGNFYSSRQLILPEACTEMPGIVSSASENYTGGGAVTDGMCTDSLCVQNTYTRTYSCPICMGILVDVFINIEIAISFIQCPRRVDCREKHYS